MSTVVVAAVVALAGNGMLASPARAADPVADGPVAVGGLAPPAPDITMLSEPAGVGVAVEFLITAASADVTKFRYGWSSTPTQEVVATGDSTKSSTVRLEVRKIGLNIFYAQSVDSAQHRGRIVSYEFIVPGPFPAVARFMLESSPGVTEAQALADGQPVLAGDTPLAGTDLSWAEDARLVGGRTATFNGGTSQAVASGLNLDTSQSFSVATWVRLTDLSGSQTIAAEDAGAGLWSPFRLQLRPTASGAAAWCFTMNASLSAGADTRVCAATPPAAGRWTHVAGGFDSVDGQMRIWVDGVETAADFTAPVNGDGPLVLGRASDDGEPTEYLRGQLADVQVFDRVLAEEDFIGHEEGSGGYHEPGMLDPMLVGSWDFDGAMACYDAGLPDFCEAPDTSPFGRRLWLTQGSFIDFGQQGMGLQLDEVHYVDDPTDPYFGMETREYGTSQRNPVEFGEPPQWTDSPVLRIDQSFTVALWVRPDAVDGETRVAVSQQGDDRPGFSLGMRSFTVDGVTGEYWSFSMHSEVDAAEDTLACSVEPIAAGQTHSWTQLVALWDASAGAMRLYVNGELQQSTTKASHWQASGPLMVGADRWAGTVADYWHGGLDELHVYQGAMSDSAVHRLYESQVID